MHQEKGEQGFTWIVYNSETLQTWLHIPWERARLLFLAHLDGWPFFLSHWQTAEHFSGRLRGTVTPAPLLSSWAHTFQLQPAFSTYQQIELPTLPGSHCINLPIFSNRKLFFPWYYLNFPLLNSILLFTPMVISLYTIKHYQLLCLPPIFRPGSLSPYSQWLKFSSS